jgi:hypothetical protein
VTPPSRTVESARESLNAGTGGSVAGGPLASDYLIEHRRHRVRLPRLRRCLGRQEPPARRASGKVPPRATAPRTGRRKFPRSEASKVDNRARTDAARFSGLRAELIRDSPDTAAIFEPRGSLSRSAKRPRAASGGAVESLEELRRPHRYRLSDRASRSSAAACSTATDSTSSRVFASDARRQLPG